MRSRASAVSLVVLICLSCWNVGRVEAVVTVTVDFEAFNIGDGVAEINAVTAPLGLTFSSAGNAQIVDVSGNKALSLTRDGGGADGLVNFSTTVEYGELRFLSNDPTTANDDSGLIVFYTAPQSAAAPDLDDFWWQDDVTPPGTASLRYSDFWFGTSVMRAMQIEQAGANGDAFLVDDLTVELNLIPEPQALIVALSTVPWLTRRRR